MTKIGARVSTFVLASLWMASAGFAQVGNSYILPGITSNDNLTIGNLNPQATTATIAFYDSSGKLSSLTVELGAGGQTRIMVRALRLPAVQLLFSVAFFAAAVLAFGRFCLHC